MTPTCASITTSPLQTSKIVSGTGAGVVGDAVLDTGAGVVGDAVLDTGAGVVGDAVVDTGAGVVGDAVSTAEELGAAEGLALIQTCGLQLIEKIYPAMSVEP